MKALTSMLAVFTLAGCSTDALQPEATIAETPFYKISVVDTTGYKNPYSNVGLLYQDMLDAYYLLPDDAPDLVQAIKRVEAVAFLNPDFVTLLNDAPYVPIGPDAITPYLTDGALIGLLSPEYSAHAARLLAAIAAQLDLLKAQDQPFQAVEAYFKDADAAIANDTVLATAEREALLTATAIVYNALDNDRKRKRRDRDWEWMTTHLAATANGALESVPQAIMLSIVTDVYHH